MKTSNLANNIKYEQMFNISNATTYCTNWVLTVTTKNHCTFHKLSDILEPWDMTYNHKLSI